MLTQLQMEIGMLWHRKQIFFESAKISGVGRVTVNQQLFNDGLTKLLLVFIFKK